VSKINFKISCHHQLSPEVCHQSHRRIFSLLLISIYRKILFYRLSQADMSGFLVKKVYILSKLDIYFKWIFTQKWIIFVKNVYFVQEIHFFVRFGGFTHENPLIVTQYKDLRIEKTDLAIHGSLTQRLNLMNPNLIPPINQILIFFISISGTFFLFKF